MVPASHILFVEDDTNDAILLQRSFRRIQMTSSIGRVTDGEQAVAYLEGRAPFDHRDTHPLPTLMLLDLKLPRRSGIEVLQWLRQQAAPLRDLPVIVLTSSRHTPDVDAANALGAHCFMAKPNGSFDGLAEMVRKIDAQLREARAGQPNH